MSIIPSEATMIVCAHCGVLLNTFMEDIAIEFEIYNIRVLRNRCKCTFISDDTWNVKDDWYPRGDLH